MADADKVIEPKKTIWLNGKEIEIEKLHLGHICELKNELRKKRIKQTVEAYKEQDMTYNMLDIVKEYANIPDLEVEKYMSSIEGAVDLLVIVSGDKEAGKSLKIEEVEYFMESIMPKDDEEIVEDTEKKIE